MGVGVKCRCTDLNTAAIILIVSNCFLQYYLYNSKLSRYELSVVEMYEDTSARPT